MVKDNNETDNDNNNETDNWGNLGSGVFSIQHWPHLLPTLSFGEALFIHPGSCSSEMLLTYFSTGDVLHRAVPNHQLSSFKRFLIYFHFSLLLHLVAVSPPILDIVSGLG